MGDVSDWIEHRRAGDREVLGWLQPAGDLFVAYDRLGRLVVGPVEWSDAESALDERGLHWLADLWQLTLPDGSVVRVRLAEVRADRVVVRADDLGGGNLSAETWVLPFPAPEALQPFAGDAGVLGTTPFGA